MILEGAMIVIASTALTVMHPGIGFGKEAWKAGDWHFRTRKEVETSEIGVSGVKSESGSGNATGEWWYGEENRNGLREKDEEEWGMRNAGWTVAWNSRMMWSWRLVLGVLDTHRFYNVLFRVSR
jgi:hypothetical protein